MSGDRTIAMGTPVPNGRLILRIFRRRIVLLLTSSLVWASLAVIAFGQNDESDSTSSSNSKLYYALVILGMVLGMIVVCRPSKRKVLEIND